MSGRRGARGTRARRARHRALGHLRQGGRRPCWQLWGETERDRADAVRVAAARGGVVRRIHRLDGRLGDAGAGHGLPRLQARGDVLRPVRAQGPRRAGRADHRGGCCCSRAAVGPDDDDHGRRPVRVRFASSARCGLPSRGPSSTSSSWRRRCGPTTSPATRSSRRARPCAIAAGEWLSTRHDFEVLIDQRRRAGRAARRRAASGA